MHRRFAHLCSLVLFATAASASAQKSIPLLPTEQVDIYYDQHMIPHVFGESDEAAFYGLGYHQVREFPVGTLNQLWRYTGRMAEIAGESYLDEDRLSRMWEIPVVAQRHGADMEASGLLSLMEAYVRGVEDGRAWWRGEKASTSRRLDSLMGTRDDGVAEIKVDPVPDYLNEFDSPFTDLPDGPTVQEQIRGTLNRLFDVDNPVTVEHVLCLGVAANSFVVYTNNQQPKDVFPLGAGFDGTKKKAESLFGSNGWAISGPGTVNGNVLTMVDSQVRLNVPHLRPYFVQVHGDDYRVAGMTMPGYPAIYLGFNDDVSWVFTSNGGRNNALVRGVWEVKLERSEDPDDLFFYLRQADSFASEIQLERVTEQLSYFDPAVGGLLQAAPETRYYVPADPALGFPGNRYPVMPRSLSADGRALPPKPGQKIRYMQASFTVEHSPWEFWLRLGQLHDADQGLTSLLDDALVSFGNGLNLLVADRTSTFRYLRMARVPIHGARLFGFGSSAPLDGANPIYRWQGYYSANQLPTIGPERLTEGEAWISNNVTPDFIEETRFDVADLAAYPDEIMRPRSSSTWRQVRGVELLRGTAAAGQVTRELNESTAADQADVWMRSMWPFFVDAQLDGSSADAQIFAQWVEAHRHVDENDQQNAAYDFVAHIYSQVTVYTTLLRSYYLNELAALSGLTPDQKSFGGNPVHALFAAGVGAFTPADYGPNRAAMVRALETTTALWRRGSSGIGLRNATNLNLLSPLIPGDPWGADPSLDPALAHPADPTPTNRFDDLIEWASPGWEDEMLGKQVTRWGHVQVLPLTPHHPRLPKASTVDPDQARALFAAITYPAAIRWDSTLNLPYFHEQPSRILPLGGVATSVFTPTHKAVFLGQAPSGYCESVYPWNDDDLLYFHPMSQGSQALLSVELLAGGGAKARFLAAIGGTEITKGNVLRDPNRSLGYQKRFAPSGNFVRGEWKTLVTDEDVLSSARAAQVHHLELTFNPGP